MSHPFVEFKAKREAGNTRLAQSKNLASKRLMALDKTAYAEGALDGATKELLGMVASMVLRCNDCIDYHLETCVQAGYSKDQIDDAIGVAMLVGGTIVIPHARHAAQTLEYLFSDEYQSQLTPPKQTEAKN